MASVIEKTIRKAITPIVTGMSERNRRRLHDEAANPFLHGIHAPMEDELTLESLDVTGTIPPELDGIYARIGPNPLGGDRGGHHWFVGDGMVHGVRLRGGTAEWYRNRYIRSRTLEERGGPKAAPGPRRGFSDTVNTNVLQVGGKTMALVEASSFPAELDEHLETVAYSDFGSGLTGSFTAHPHECPATGEFHAICYEATDENSIRHVALDATGKVLRETRIEVRHGPSIHDCALTENYVVILDLPVCFSTKALIAGYQFPYRWNRDHQARIGLLPRSGDASQIIWCPVDPCYVFHVGNSFEDAQGRVIIDCCVYETMFDGDMPGPYGHSLGLERWTLDPQGGAVARATLDLTPQEFPRPDERFFTKPYRYLWSVGLPADHSPDFFSAAPLNKHDLATGERTTRIFGDHAMPGEFVFVPHGKDAGEGEGWVMGYVIDTRSRSCALEICDAQSLETVASVRIPHIIPPGFHGNWLRA